MMARLGPGRTIGIETSIVATNNDARSEVGGTEREGGREAAFFPNRHPSLFGRPRRARCPFRRTYSATLRLNAMIPSAPFTYLSVLSQGSTFSHEQSFCYADIRPCWREIVDSDISSQFLSTVRRSV